MVRALSTHNRFRAHLSDRCDEVRLRAPPHERGHTSRRPHTARVLSSWARRAVTKKSREGRGFRWENLGFFCILNIDLLGFAEGLGWFPGWISGYVFVLISNNVIL